MVVSPLTENESILKKQYPGWFVLIEAFSDRYLTAGDIKKVLGITYRQLNDWEKRGIIKTIMERPFVKKAEGWRKFSIFDLFLLSVLVELKKQGIPVTRLQNVLSIFRFAEQDKYELLPNIVLGVKCYFYTNLDDLIGYQYLGKRDKFLSISRDILDTSKVIIVIPLLPIIENIFKKVINPNLAIIKKNDGGFKFVIKSVPLALEPLPKVENE